MKESELKTLSDALSIRRRQAAEDRLIAKGWGFRLADGKFALSEAGRDAADHVRMELK